MNYLLVFLGGGIGSMLRFGVGKACVKWTSAFPISTLISNFLACILFTLILYFWTKDLRGDWVLPFALVGLCGGFSTFSTFSFENFIWNFEKYHFPCNFDSLFQIFLKIFVFHLICK